MTPAVVKSLFAAFATAAATAIALVWVQRRVVTADIAERAHADGYDAGYQDAKAKRAPMLNPQDLPAAYKSGDRDAWATGYRAGYPMGTRASE